MFQKWAYNTLVEITQINNYDKILCHIIEKIVFLDFIKQYIATNRCLSVRQHESVTIINKS